MPMRGIRGAIDLRRNSGDEIRASTQELLRELVGENGIDPKDIAAALFTATPDLTADFPAHAARDLGWTEVPMMCNQELDVKGGMKRVIRILLLVNTTLPQDRIRHQYLGETSCLRPDLARNSRTPTGRKRTRPNPSNTRGSARKKR